MNDSAYYESERQKTNCQIEYTNNQNAAYRRKIERLTPVKRILTEQKELFRIVKSKCNTNLEAPEEWKGRTKVQYDQHSMALKQGNESFYQDMDAALDAVNNEITRCENAIYSNNGLLGRLRAYLNSLLNDVENMCN